MIEKISLMEGLCLREWMSCYFVEDWRALMKFWSICVVWEGLGCELFLVSLELTFTFYSSYRCYEPALINAMTFNNSER